MKTDLLNGSLGFLKNRYALTAIFGLVWVTFVSEIDLIYLVKSQRELSQLRSQAAHYQLQIATTSEQLEALSSEPGRLERFAREQYFMKKDDEDLFRIVPGASLVQNPK